MRADMNNFEQTVRQLIQNGATRVAARAEAWDITDAAGQPPQATLTLRSVAGIPAANVPMQMRLMAMQGAQVVGVREQAGTWLVGPA